MHRPFYLIFLTTLLSYYLFFGPSNIIIYKKKHKKCKPHRLEYSRSSQTKVMNFYIEPCQILT